MSTRGDKIQLGGILQKRDLAKISIMAIPDRPGVASIIFGALGARGVNCPFIVHTIDLNDLDSIVLCVARGQLSTALAALREVQEEVEAEAVVHDDRVGMISIFGPHFGDRYGIASELLHAIEESGVDLLALNCTIASIIGVVPSHQIKSAIQAIQGCF